MDHGVWSQRMLAARGPTIYAGTNQVQHNIIGERVLGLPKG
jgi:alkylation response protein AidB-like acyl-CoA dehydrogenase